ncbi:MAG: IS3 family transposase [Clostridia bacterium]|nr:IS3 family transposase [Clostridia bacterium]
MFSHQERIKAVKLLVQYDMSYAGVIRELGYPTRTALTGWYKEYAKDNDLHERFVKKPIFNIEERQKAVNYYLEHGKCVSRTVRILGYPSRPILDKWIKELAPKEKKHCRSGGSLIRYTREQKEKAVVALCSRSKTAKEVANEMGVTRETLYNWKRQLLNEGCNRPMAKRDKFPKLSMDANHNDQPVLLQSEKEHLTKQVSELKQEIYRLRLERDILEKAAEIIKKDEGISLKKLSNGEKAIVINALREKYPLRDLLVILNIAKSSYCYQATVLANDDKYFDLRANVKDVFNDNSKCYGYRRIHSVIKSTGIAISEKVIRRIMKEEQLLISSKKGKKYNSYKGEVSPAVENIINRDFHAEKPNLKWLTDLTEFHIPAGKVYLSPIIDCFDGLPVSWSIGTSPDAELVNTMLDEAILTLKKDEQPIVHSDRGCHYRWPGWIKRMERAQLMRSMSKKGCSPDNSACEGFFGRLKNEMFCGYSWVDITIDQFIEHLDEYLKWYAEKRIKLSLGGMSPLAYRKSLGLAV